MCKTFVTKIWKSHLLIFYSQNPFCQKVPFSKNHSHPPQIFDPPKKKIWGGWGGSLRIHPTPRRLSLISSNLNEHPDWHWNFLSTVLHQKLIWNDKKTKIQGKSIWKHRVYNFTSTPVLGRWTICQNSQRYLLIVKQIPKLKTWHWCIPSIKLYFVGIVAGLKLAWIKFNTSFSPDDVLLLSQKYIFSSDSSAKIRKKIIIHK